MLIQPADHYVLHEWLATDAKDLRRFIDTVNTVAARRDCDVYWRGQADHRWGVQSSLARLAARPTAVRDMELQAAEAELLKEAENWVTAVQVAPSNSLEWLALFQHHGVPTRLVDFTRDPLIAVFFAVESLDSTEGRLFAIAVPRSNSKVDASNIDDFEIRSLKLGELRIWEPTSAVSPRLVAQQGAFAIGRLPSTNPARFVRDPELSSERLMTRAEVVSVTSIPLYFVATDRGDRDGAKYPSCFTARLHVDKSSVLEQLSKRAPRGALRPSGDPINHSRCYPDVDGMRTHSLTLQRLLRGI